MKSFLKIFQGSKKKDEQDVPSATSRAVAKRITSILGLRSLESMPAQAARAFSLASDPKAGVPQFVSLIEADDALGARVVRIANSVYFLRGDPVKDIEQAVVTIGIDELRSMLSATMLESMLKGKEKEREYIWANSVGTAIGARLLAKRTTNLAPSEAFLCGLVHDVGKLIMLRRDPMTYRKVLSLVSSGEKDFFEAEEELFEINHVEVGKWAAESWNFPPVTISSINYHHRSYQQLDNQIEALATGSGEEIKIELSLPLIVKIADELCHSIGIGHPGGFSGFQARCRAQLPLLAQILAVSNEDLEKICAQIHSMFEQEIGIYSHA